MYVETFKTDVIVFICIKGHNVTSHLGDNCILLENFMASIGDLMVAN